MFELCCNDEDLMYSTNTAPTTRGPLFVIPAGELFLRFIPCRQLTGSAHIWMIITASGTTGWLTLGSLGDANVLVRTL